MDDETPLGMLSIEMAAKYLGVSVNSVRRLAKEGDLPHARYVGKLHFRLVDLDLFVDCHTVEAA